MASQQLATLIEQIRAQRTEELPSTAEFRQIFEVMGAAVPLLPDVSIEPVSAGGVPAEWVRAGAAGPATVLYLHGGGYTIGSAATYREMVSRLARAASGACLLLDYRLAPEHPFPAAVDDAVAAYRWLRGRIDPARLVIAGDSAGGGLTLALLISLRDAGEPLPAAGVCLSPWVDLELKGESMRTLAGVDPMLRRDWLERCVRDYAGANPPGAPLLSPLSARLDGLPPLLIQVGTAETLLDDAKRLAERARAARVDCTLDVWEDMIHIWQFFAAILPEGQQAIDQLGDWIRTRVA